MCQDGCVAAIGEKVNKKSGTSKDAADKLVRGIKRKTRKHYSAAEKIKIALDGLRGEESIAALCPREGIAESLYYNWSKELLEAGKARLAGDTARQATAPEVKELRSESGAVKEVFAELTLEDRLLKKTYGPSRLQRVFVGADIGLQKRIRHVGLLAAAKMEIRTFRSS